MKNNVRMLSKSNETFNQGLNESGWYKEKR